MDPKAAVAKVKPSDFEETARRVCKLNLKDAHATYPDVSEENIPYLCIDLVYQYTLLVDGFGMLISNEKNITITVEHITSTSMFLHLLFFFQALILIKTLPW